MRWPSQGLCVLTFHRIAERCDKDHDVTWRSFRMVLNDIAANGATVDARLDSEDGFPQRAVGLTFDDATADHARVAEELAGRRMPGVFFIPAGKVGRPGYLSMPEVRGLAALGHRVGSHALNDLPLDDRMPPEIVSRELSDSKKALEDWTGTRVTYFAPPGGVERASAARELLASGYTASRSMRWGIYRSLRDRWSIPCIPVTEFTLACGWVIHAVRTREVPLAMRSGWTVKRLMPEPVRHSVRKMLHSTFRAGR